MEAREGYRHYHALFLLSCREGWTWRREETLSYMGGGILIDAGKDIPFLKDPDGTLLMTQKDWKAVVIRCYLGMKGRCCRGLLKGISPSVPLGPINQLQRPEEVGFGQMGKQRRTVCVWESP